MTAGERGWETDTAQLADILCLCMNVEQVNRARRATLAAPGSLQDPDGDSDLALLRAFLRQDPRRLSWQTVAGRSTGALLRRSCAKLAGSRRPPVTVRRRDPVSVQRADKWCHKATGTASRYALAREMSGVFSYLCIHPAQSHHTCLAGYLWGCLQGGCEYYLGAEQSSSELTSLVEQAILVSRRCLHAHGAAGAVATAAQLECLAVQIVDNICGVLRYPDLYFVGDYIKLRGVDVGVFIFTPDDDSSGAFVAWTQEATIAAILAHDLIDHARDRRNGNPNNLCAQLPDLDQLWDFLLVCLSHRCAVAGEQWERVVAGFVVGTCVYARGGRERQASTARTVVTSQPQPSMEWSYAPRMHACFTSGDCDCVEVTQAVDIHPSLERIYTDSARAVAAWRQEQPYDRPATSELQILALACAAEVRTRSQLFTETGAAQRIY